jgi:hypothetical protein
MTAGYLGQMVTPKAGNRLIAGGVPWALDSGVVKLVDGRPVTDPAWSPERYYDMLERYQDVPGCLFACVPDVVADLAGTQAMWGRWWSGPTRMGYRPAWVAQDGCWYIPRPAEALFIGGSTAWKLGPQARALAALAKRHGLWVHMGRVNSAQRMRFALEIGCDSVDGTFLAYGPDQNLPRLLRYLRQVNTQPSLWDLSA